MTEINDFAWGPVVKVHEISEIQVVEYHPAVFEGCSATGEYHTHTYFHTFLREEDLYHGFKTLDEAILFGIQHKYSTDLNAQAHRYAALILGVTNE